MSKEKIPKVLVLTVGVGRGEAIQKSLADALGCAISDQDPKKVFFICTEESKSTIDSIKNVNCDHELILLKDPDNIQSIFNILLPKFRKIRRECDKAILDYTSGTKSMSAGAVLAAIMSDFDRLEVIGGERENGIVKPKTEIITNFRTDFIKPELIIREALALFNAGRYDSCHQALEGIKGTNQLLSFSIENLDRLALAYSYWDRFDHTKANEFLNRLNFSIKKIDEAINKNKRFLGKLMSSNDLNRYGYMTADLLNNAKRRARECKYDDAVARLYRTIEGLAEYRLLVNGIDLNNINQEKLHYIIKDGEKASYWIAKIEGGKLKIALKEKFILLSNIADDTSGMYLNDKELQSLLTNRNYSILAHGWKTIAQDDCERLYNKIELIARMIFKDLDSMIEDSCFIEIDQSLI